MKILVKTFILFLFIVLLSCDKLEPENNIACFTPPANFPFEIVDKTTGENLFTNGTYKSDQIVVTDLATKLKVPFKFIPENGLNILDIGSIGWKTEKANYSITIQDKDIFELYVDASRLKGDNCSYTVYNQVLIKNAEYEFNKEKGRYIIKIQLEK
jgi:hypothetical protein